MNTPHRDAIRHRAQTAVTGLAVIVLGTGHFKPTVSVIKELGAKAGVVRYSYSGRRPAGCADRARPWRRGRRALRVGWRRGEGRDHDGSREGENPS